MDKSGLPDVPFKVHEVDINGNVVRTSSISVEPSINTHALVFSEDEDGKLSATLKDRGSVTEEELDFSDTLSDHFFSGVCAPIDPFRVWFEEYKRFHPRQLNVIEAIDNVKVEPSEEKIRYRMIIPSIESLAHDGAFYMVSWKRGQMAIARHKLPLDRDHERDIGGDGAVIVNDYFIPIDFHRIYPLNPTSCRSDGMSESEISGIASISYRRKAQGTEVSGIIIHPRTPVEDLKTIVENIKTYHELGFVNPIEEMVLRETTVNKF